MISEKLYKDIRDQFLESNLQYFIDISEAQFKEIIYRIEFMDISQTVR